MLSDSWTRGEVLDAVGVLLSLLAIVLALIVALIEQRRTRREIEMQEIAEKRREDALINASIHTVDAMLDVLDAEISILELAQRNGEGWEAPVRRVAREALNSATVVQAWLGNAPFDAAVAATLAEVFRSLERLGELRSLPADSSLAAGKLGAGRAKLLQGREALRLKLHAGSVFARRPD